MMVVRDGSDISATPAAEFCPVAGDVYPRYTPGTYEVRCNRVDPYEDPQFHRYIALLRCNILGSKDEVVAFLNLGKEKGAKIGMRSKYRKVWCMANGGPPKNRQRLSFGMFVGKNFKVVIGDSGPKCSEYSKITEILECTHRGTSCNQAIS